MSRSNTAAALMHRESRVVAKPSLNLGVQVINEAVVRSPFNSMKMNASGAKILLSI